MFGCAVREFGVNLSFGFVSKGILLVRVHRKLHSAVLAQLGSLSCCCRGLSTLSARKQRTVAGFSSCKNCFDVSSFRHSSDYSLGFI